MSKQYTTISVIPGLAKIVDRPFHKEDYSSVESIVDKSKWIPESQVLSQTGMTMTGVYDGDVTLESPVPLSRQRGLDPAVISTHIRNEQSKVKNKVDDFKAAAAQQQKVDETLNNIQNLKE